MRDLTILACCLLLLASPGCSKAGRPANQVEVWHWMTDRHEALESLARQYQKETGIKVKLELFAPSDAYSQKVIAAAQANALPEVYGILNKKSIVASFIKAGLVADLTFEFKSHGAEWEKRFYPRAVEVNRFDVGNIDQVKPGIYGVPIDMTSVKMIYNKSLLRKAGISHPPSTFEEFLNQIDALKRVGVTPFVSGFGEMWLIDCFASNYAFNIMGQDKVMETFRGNVPYTDPDWIKVFSIFKTLADRGAFMDGIVTRGNKYAEQDFALERAAFAFNGAWAVNVYESMNRDLDYGVTDLPPYNTQRPMRSWGGAGSSFNVNDQSPNKQKAVAFLKWLTAREQQVRLASETKNLPATKNVEESIPDRLSEFARGFENATHPSIWPLNEHPLVIEAFDKGIQAIIIGEKTPEQVAAEVQTVKSRELNKNRSRS